MLIQPIDIFVYAWLIVAALVLCLPLLRLIFRLVTGRKAPEIPLQPFAPSRFL